MKKVKPHRAANIAQRQRSKESQYCRRQKLLASRHGNARSEALPKRNLARARANLAYVAGCLANDPIIVIDGTELLSRTPTSALDIKDNHRMVMAAKKAVFAQASEGGHRIIAERLLNQNRRGAHNG